MKNLPQIYTEYVNSMTTSTSPEHKNVALGLESGSRKLISTLHKCDFVVSETIGSTAFSLSWVLRKNRRDIASINDSDSMIACGGRFAYYFSASGAAAAHEPDKFDAPPNGRIDFVRPGRLWVQGTANKFWAAILYYSLRIATDEEVAQLMVKNHG